MKYWGRSLLVFVTIITVLYGTREVWDLKSYNAFVGVQGHSELYVAEGYQKQHKLTAAQTLGKTY